MADEITRETVEAERDIAKVTKKAEAGIAKVASSDMGKTVATGASAGAGFAAGGRITDSVMNAGAQSAGAFFWIMLTILLYITDIWVTGFDGVGFRGLDFNAFVQRTLLTNIGSILGAVMVGVIGYIILGKNVHKKDATSFGVLIFVFTLIVLMGGWYRGIFHLVFIAVVYFGLILPSYENKTKANDTTTFLLFLDFFGYGLIAYSGNPLLANRLIIPFWFYYVLALTWKQKKNILSWVMIFAVILWNVFGLLSTVGAMPAIEQEFTEMQAREATEYYASTGTRIWSTITGIPAAIKSRTERSIQYAAGGYYEGEVEKAQKEPLGVYIQDMKPADRQFYEDEAVTVWATLKVNNLDEEKPVGVQISCLSDKETDKQKSGEMIPKESFEIYTLEEEDLQCRFGKGELETGSRKVSMFADFNFETMAYLKSYFMDVERLRAMRRDNINVFSSFGISDTKPIAKYTPGPVKIGIESKEPPIGLSTDSDTNPLIGITLSNQAEWKGFIKKINDIIVYVPASMELDLASCDAAFEPYPEGDLHEDFGEGHKAYKLKKIEMNKDKYKNIKEFVSFRCRLLVKAENMQDVLGGVPFATKFMRVTVDYDYRLEESTTANVVRAPGFNVQLKPAKATANNNLECVGTHDKKNIKIGEYRFVKVDESGIENIIDKGTATPLLSNQRRLDAKLPKEILARAGIKKGDKIRCIMDNVILSEGGNEADSDLIEIKNTPPEVTVKIKKPAPSTETLECEGTVKDMDNDLVDVIWEFSEGYFKKGECKRLSDKAVCKTGPIPASELSVGERIRCRMTPRDDENTGQTKEDYVVIS